MKKDNINNEDITRIACNIISAMFCYMNKEFTKEQLIYRIMSDTNNNQDIKEHIETLININLK